MKTKMYLLINIGLLFFLYEPLNAQINNRETNLFTIGKQIVTCEDNFSNFFLNFSKYVKNADIINFLGYHYVGIVKSETHAKRYLRKNFDSQMPKLIFNVSNQKDGIKKESWITLEKDPMSDSYKIKDVVNTLSTDYIQTGDKIYALKFILEGKTHEYFIFCNAQTQYVVTYGNIFGAELRNVMLL